MTLNLTTMLLDDPLGSREPESGACAAFLGSKERLENFDIISGDMP